MTTTTTEPRGMEWDDPIDVDGDSSFQLLPAGDYVFKVEDVLKLYSRKHNCHQADVKLLVLGDGIHAVVKESFLLREDLKWKIAAFFRSIGLKKHGETYVMDWDAAKGRLGKARIEPDSFEGREGNTIVVNKVKKYYDADAKAPVQAPQPEPQEEELPF